MDVVIPRKPRRGKYLLGGAAAAVALTGVAAGIVGMGRAAPGVPRSTLWIDAVQRGELIRDVSAPGTLVSDEVRFVTARVAGLVDRVHVKAGARVEPDTLLIDLSNPDLEFAALEAATAVKQARADALDLQATLGIQRIEQQAEIENVRAQYREAKRRADASAPLAERMVVSRLDSQQMREHSEELSERLKLHEEHAVALGTAAEARLTGQRARVSGLAAQAELRAGMVEALHVRAGAHGLLAEMDIESGQQVASGAVLGKIIDPDKLRAELRVPEARAKEVAVGLPVQVTVQTETVSGHVTRIDPTVQGGNVRVDVDLDGEAPKGARLDLSIDGRIEMERVSDALFIGKPAGAGENGSVSLFRLLDDGRTAIRVVVRLGRSSVNAVEVLSGLRKGDRVILSDMTEWSDVERIELE
jgi:HlyD family secretion protein